MSRFSFLIIGLLLSGCQSLPFNRNSMQSESSLSLCPATQNGLSVEARCELYPWLNYWVSVSKQDWSVRKTMIDALKPNDREMDKLKVVLLSNGPDTPYQPRLRAQLFANALIKSQQQELADFIRLLIYEPSQRRLELESAVTTLSRINTENDKQIQAQQLRIAEQAKQIDKILQIERSIVEKPDQGQL